MSDDFIQLITDIETEAKAEGPEAVRELERLRRDFGLASQLIQGRRDRKLSQRELAKLSGVPQSEISRIETGAGNPTYATITALLRPLGKRVELVDDPPAITVPRGVASKLGRTAPASRRPAKAAGSQTAAKAA